MLAAVGACAPTQKSLQKEAPERRTEARLRLTPVLFSSLAGWSGDFQGAAVAALRRSCVRLTKKSGKGLMGDRSVPGGIGGTLGAWRAICAAAAGLDSENHAAARAFFETWFRPHLAAAGNGEGDGDTDGLFTGYYEAELSGALRPHGAYRVPIYAPPRDLVSADLGRFKPEWKGQRIVGRVAGGRLLPYPSRAEIEQGALRDRGLELLWVDDPVDAFFLHVQGSGRVILEDGRVVRLGFAGRNGHPYVSIGRLLIERGEIAREAMSMQAIRRWIAAHPRQGAELMKRNPSYIFFAERPGDGPIGAQGAALTPGRSLAVDRHFVPLGLPVWLDTTDPLDANRPLRRLVIAQDTGSAIKGPVRGDLFWGYGEAAAERAGAMKQRGRYYLLLPKAR